MNQNERLQSVRAYLLQRLSPPERAAFEAAMAADPELARETALQSAEMAVGELLLETQAREWIATHRRQPQPWPALWYRKRTVIALLAAGLALVLAAVWWFRTPATRGNNHAPLAQQTPVQPAPVAVAPGGGDAKSPAKEDTKPAASPADGYLALARENFEEPPLRTLRTSMPAGPEGNYRLAEQAYARGDYRTTLALLEQTDSAQQQLAAFLSGHALFHLGRFEAAASQFDSLVEQNSRQFRYDSEWERALCRLAEKNTRQAAREQLRHIAAQPDHPYAERAGALLRKLPRPLGQ